ncbi:MAG: hypothetical protein PHX55_08775 [Eubacteriales bacterium]|nr:hypothetical protein [Eubacteriales bacterium]
MKSVVMDIKKNQAILLRDDGQFATVSNHSYSIGDIVMDQKITVRKRLYAMAATAAAVILLVSAGVFAYMAPYYHVSVDVNPGIMIQANWMRRVIHLEAANDDAKTITAEIQWKNRTIEQVMNDTIDEIEEQGYFQQDADVLIATASRNREKAMELAGTLAETARSRHMANVRVSADAVGFSMVQAAKDAGMTPGKYNLVTRLMDETIGADNAETYRNRSVKELMVEFAEAQHQNMIQNTGEQDPDIGEQNQNRNGTEINSEGNQFAEQKAGDAEPKATEQRQVSEQNAGETAQKETEQNRLNEQEPSGTTQRATEQNRDPAQDPVEATQRETEQNRVTVQEPSGTAQRNTGGNQQDPQPTEPVAGN